jgi:hypothetical protein
VIKKPKQLRILSSYPLAQYMLLGFFPRRINELLAATRLFFIVGMGRSGTKFLSLLLDRIPGCSVYHEVESDRDALIDAYWYPEKAGRYIDTRRNRLIAARILRDRAKTYGEVNSYLRFHVDALRSRGSLKILHLVRDGRAVVQSLMNRNSFKRKDENHTGRIFPKEGDRFASEWSNMNRFARTCWYWSSTNKYLMERNLPIVRFEDIIESYDQFDLQVLQSLNLKISYDIWCAQVQRPRNVSKTINFPDWEEWEVTKKNLFKDICGDTMTTLGYEL